jgi:hypothetical protein
VRRRQQQSRTPNKDNLTKQASLTKQGNLTNQAGHAVLRHSFLNALWSKHLTILNSLKHVKIINY